MNKKNLIIILFIFTVLSFFLPIKDFGCGIQTSGGELSGHVSCTNEVLKIFSELLDWVFVIIFFIMFVFSFFFKTVTKKYFIIFGIIFILSIIIKYALYFYITYLDNRLGI